MIPSSALDTLVAQPEWLARGGDGVDLAAGVADTIDRLVPSGVGKVSGWLKVSVMDELEEMPCLASVRYVQRVVCYLPDKVSCRAVVGQLMVRCPRADVWAWVSDAWYFFRQRVRLPAATVIRVKTQTENDPLGDLGHAVGAILYRAEFVPNEVERAELVQLLDMMVGIRDWAQNHGDVFDALGHRAEELAQDLQEALHPYAS